MVDSTKQALQDNIANITNDINAANSNLAALKADGNYTWALSRIAIIKAAGKWGQTDTHGNHYWADGSGVIWVGNDSQAEYVKYMGVVNSNESHINSQQAAIDDMEKKLTSAQKALADYLSGLNNSPEAQQAIAKINSANTIAAQQAKTKKIIIISVIAAGTLLVLTVVWFIVKKEKASESK